MIQNILVDNQRVKINSADVLGSGGEATVIKYNNFAVKIYHQINQFRKNKLDKFINLSLDLPKSVCAPEKLVYDTKQNVVGYMMKLISQNNEVVQHLSSKTFRKTHPDIDNKYVVDLFIDAYKTVSNIHKHMIIGDFNDLNVVFKDRKMTFIDVDSFSIDGFPCVVGTENFLPPELYDLDLAQKSYFIPEHDWYSWMCMFIRSLLFVHPYGGIHCNYKTLQQRAINRVSCFDKGVIYPRIAQSPDILNKNLQELFYKFFKNGERFTPNVELFIDYNNSLISCLSCQCQFPSERKSCPQCATVNLIEAQRKTITDTKTDKKIKCSTFLCTKGQFIWIKVINSICHAVAIYNGKYLYFSKSLNSDTIIEKEISKHINSAKFDVFGDFLVVHGQSSDTELQIINIKTWNKITSKKVDFFKSQPAFSCSRDFLFRISNGYIFKTYFDTPSEQLIDQNIGAASNNQTFIQSCNLNKLFVYHRLFDILKFYLYEIDKNGKLYQYDLLINDIKSENIIDVDIKFSSNVFILIKSEVQGRTYSRYYIFNKDKLIISQKMHSISSDLYKNIFGKAFMSSDSENVVLHPTDSGVVQEMLIGQKTITLVGSEQFVDESDELVPFVNGILVWKNQEIKYLTIG